MASDIRCQATAVIPGSHLWGTDRAPKVDEVTYAEMEPGSALFTLGCEYNPVDNHCRALLNVFLQQHITVLVKTNAKKMIQTLYEHYSRSSGKYT